MDKEQTAMERLRLASDMSLRLYHRPLLLTDSGGKDIAEALGYSNPRKALADHVEEEDKGVTKCYTPGGAQEMTIINESGVYSLIFASTTNSRSIPCVSWLSSEGAT